MTFFLMLFILLSAANTALGFFALFGGSGGGVGSAALLFSLSATLFLLTAIWWKVSDMYDLLKKSVGSPRSPAQSPIPASPKE
jgi:hypothetical protein